MFMAWIAFGDKIQIMNIAGITIVLIGVLLSQFNKKEPIIE